MLTDDALMERGAQAEQASAYVSGIVSRAKEMIFDRIMALNPDEATKFTIYKSQLLLFDDLEAMVDGDIRDGKKAVKRLQGDITQKGGIL